MKHKFIGFIGMLMLAVTIFLNNGRIIKGEYATVNAAGTTVRVSQGWGSNAPDLTIPMDDVDKMQGEVHFKSHSYCFIGRITGEN